MLDPKGVSFWLNNARLLVVPSLKEGFPTVVLEAMSYGIPVVGYNIGGLPELVRHGLDGLLVPATDRGPCDVNRLFVGRHGAFR